ncbi:unnamed protein product, partial [Rotaria sp. Silwood1]
LIIAANIVIVVVLHCASYNSRTSDDSNKRESDLSCCQKNLSTASLRQNYPDRSITTVAELVLATKQRTNAQITRASVLKPDLTPGTTYSHDLRRVSSKTSPSQVLQSVEVLFNGKNALTNLDRQK